MACVDDQRRRFDIRRFHRNTVILYADAGEHLVANLPGIMSTAPRVRVLCAGQGRAKGVYGIAIHGHHDDVLRDFQQARLPFGAIHTPETKSGARAVVSRTDARVF